ncbi:phosphoribosylaminoimidazole-succinocarboxamide synthase [Lactococcus piscium]|uniref:Phosphoribosylaminoimidazole-succinocarboxamide synthase n=1 Tax=Pseudolactococcus piscium TaxID=1364 RepID=A0A2A5RV08_9LACT|nr:phosphoribosylaminoimidazolesuccinocarboxamide synthase [Lactococcus piscium]PCS05062.1 phosphoribosylaminoimidazole-succinocarboxamide synthase [Lactococcus piscium]
MTEKRTLLYEGKAKNLYLTDDDSIVLAQYKDQATALNGKKKDQISGKGALNNQITSLIFRELNRRGVPTHFIEQISKTEQLNTKVDIIPLEVVVRNYTAGSFSKRFDLAEGIKLATPIVEFYYKNDDLDDPFINDAHVKFLEIASDEEIVMLKENALAIDLILTDLFAKIDLKLIDFKLEFGRLPDGTIILADEISPDTSRLWDVDNNHVDKDVYRRDLGDLIPIYQRVLTDLQTEFEGK